MPTWVREAAPLPAPTVNPADPTPLAPMMIQKLRHILKASPLILYKEKIYDLIQANDTTGVVLGGAGLRMALSRSCKKAPSRDTLCLRRGSLGLLQPFCHHDGSQPADKANTEEGKDERGGHGPWTATSLQVTF